MTADEMFEELGYEFYLGSPETLSYHNVKIDNCILFWIKDKRVEVYWETISNCYRSVPIDMPLLNAINLKCKELGWIE